MEILIQLIKFDIFLVTEKKIKSQTYTRHRLQVAGQTGAISTRKLFDLK